MTETEFINNKDNSIQYPLLNFNITESIAEEILKIGTQFFNNFHNKFNGTKLELFLLIIENIRTSFIKMQVGSLLIKKILSISFESIINCETFFKILSTKSWLYYENSTNKIIPIENIKNYDIFTIAKNSPQKYKQKITSSDYFNLIFMTFKSYLCYMRLPNIIKILEGTKNNDKFIIEKSKIHCDNIFLDASLVFRYSDDIKWFNEIVKLIENDTEINETLEKFKQFLRYIVNE